MKAILRRGRSLYLPGVGVRLERNSPQRLERVADYVYIAAAHGHRLQLEPAPTSVTMQRGQQRRQVAPWQVADMKRNGWQTQPLDQALKSGSRVLVIRNMGLGDVLMLTPALYALHRQRGVQVHLATYARYLPLMWGLEWIEASYALGTDYYVERFNVVVDLNWAVESNPEAQRQPRAEIFADRLGVELHRRQPFYQVADSERQQAQRWLSQHNLPLVGIQVHASCPQRSYPAEHILHLTDLLQAAGYTVAFYGQQWDNEVPQGVINLIGAATLRQTAALIEQMAVMVCPDSGLLHLSVAVGTPTVGLFGPIPPELRTSGYPRCTTLTAAGSCPKQPCFDIGVGQCRNYRCMRAIAPEAVLAAIQRQIKDHSRHGTSRHL